MARNAQYPLLIREVSEATPNYSNRGKIGCATAVKCIAWFRDTKSSLPRCVSGDIYREMNIWYVNVQYNADFFSLNYTDSFKVLYHALERSFPLDILTPGS